MADPPKYGDFEAQRHWMELTWHRPRSNWYHVDYDEWWQLDYPPLSAYFALAWAAIANAINPEWVAWKSSRGREDPNLVLFMRSTVILADITLLFPATYYILRDPSSITCSTSSLAFFIALTLPASLVTDHAHFQYNGVAMALVLLALALAERRKHAAAAAAYVFSFMFKQTTLMLAPCFAAYYIGHAHVVYLQNSRKFKTKGLLKAITSLAIPAIGVAAAFAISLAPMAPHCCADIVRRVFPSHRDIFENVTANAWRMSNFFVRWPKRFSRGTLAALCATTSLLACVPAILALLRAPHSSTTLLRAASLCALAGYFFGYMVHEKTILIVCQIYTIARLREAAAEPRLGPRLLALPVIASAALLYPLSAVEGWQMPLLGVTVMSIIAQELDKRITSGGYGGSPLFARWTAVALPFIVVALLSTFLGDAYHQRNPSHHAYFIALVPFVVYVTVYIDLSLGLLRTAFGQPAAKVKTQ